MAGTLHHADAIVIGSFVSHGHTPSLRGLNLNGHGHDFCRSAAGAAIAARYLVPALARSQSRRRLRRVHATTAGWQRVRAVPAAAPTTARVVRARPLRARHAHAAARARSTRFVVWV